MTDDGWEREKTRPTHGNARSEAFRGLAEDLATRLDAESARRGELGTALDRQSAEACRNLARRARVVASRFASWAPGGGWDATRRADVEEYDRLRAAARGFGLGDGGPAADVPAASTPPGGTPATKATGSDPGTGGTDAT